jgi:TRAP transporter TAXI family solute receptor
MQPIFKDLENAVAPASNQGIRIIMDLFDVGPGVAISSILVSILAISYGVFYFVQSAPPSTITISTGPVGSALEKQANKYKAILEKNSVKVNVINSQGSFENLQRLIDGKSADLAFVQGGLTIPGTENLVSLGSVSYQPLMVFYRGSPIELISEMAGKRIAIGPEGSGTRKFALSVLNANGITEGGSTALLDLDGNDAATGLSNGKIDVAFIMSESSSTEIVHNLLHSKDIHLYNFKQAYGYSRKIDYLNVLELPQGTIDFGLNIPQQDTLLLGPMVELVARRDFHPALVDLVLDAATQVHSRPGIFQKRGEFPASVEHAIALSPDAVRYHKSGKGWLSHILPFWLASLVTRLTVVALPMLLFLIPALKSIPAFFRWRTQMGIRRHYRHLLVIEQKFLQSHSSDQQGTLRAEFDKVERAVNKMRVRAAFADQFYSLRGHIDYVRSLAEKDVA